MKSLLDPACKEELFRRLAEIEANTPRKWGFMTAPQMICHLSDCFLGVMGDRPMAIPPGSTLLSLFRPMVLYMPMK
jgi:hypothetical protein